MLAEIFMVRLEAERLVLVQGGLPSSTSRSAREATSFSRKLRRAQRLHAKSGLWQRSASRRTVVGAAPMKLMASREEAYLLRSLLRAPKRSACTS